MSNRVKNIKKNITDNKVLYINLLNTVYGSLVQSVRILNQMPWSNEEYINRMKKGKFPYIGDKDFIKKTLETVGIDYEDVKGLPICLVESDFNSLFLPYIEEDGEKYPMPINEEAILPQTLLKAKSINYDIWSD